MGQLNLSMFPGFKDGDDGDGGSYSNISIVEVENGYIISYYVDEDEVTYVFSDAKSVVKHISDLLGA
jgi:hypothetical protein